MIFVACSGFPGPVTRYWGELPAVELSESENALPGPGTVRRLLRESPAGFRFTLLAPKTIAASGFAKRGKQCPGLLETLELAKQMEARAVVFVAAPEFLGSKANRVAVRSFAEALPKGFPTAVFDLPGFEPGDLEKTLDGTAAVAAVNPLRGKVKTTGDFLYIRLPGPAGHRSRYEEVALERIIEHLRHTKAKETYCVFANIDMFANAKAVVAALKGS